MTERSFCRRLDDDDDELEVVWHGARTSDSTKGAWLAGTRSSS